MPVFYRYGSTFCRGASSSCRTNRRFACIVYLAENGLLRARAGRTIYTYDSLSKLTGVPGSHSAGERGGGDDAGKSGASIAAD